MCLGSVTFSTANPASPGRRIPCNGSLNSQQQACQDLRFVHMTSWQRRPGKKPELIVLESLFGMLLLCFWIILKCLVTNF
jgi:hypothetical protein